MTQALTQVINKFLVQLPWSLIGSFTSITQRSSVKMRFNTASLVDLYLDLLQWRLLQHVHALTFLRHKLVRLYLKHLYH